MDGQQRETLALIAEIAFALAGFAVVAVALRSRQDEQWPPAARLRAQSLLFASLSPGILALFALGSSASGVAEETTYRVVSAIWLGSSVWFAIFSFRFTRRLRANSETSLAIDASGNALYLAFFGVAGLQTANAAFLGSF